MSKFNYKLFIFDESHGTYYITVLSSLYLVGTIWLYFIIFIEIKSITTLVKYKK